MSISGDNTSVQEGRLPTVNVTSALARFNRATSRLNKATRALNAHQAEHEAAEAAYKQATAALDAGHVSPGRAHARFDTQTLRWSIDADKLAKHLPKQMLTFLRLIFDGDLDGAATVTMTGERLRNLIETRLPTRSGNPIRMYYLFRTEFISRGILRQL